MGSRRKGRVIAFQAIYSWEINRYSLDNILKFDWLDYKQDDLKEEAVSFAKLLVQGIIENIDEIDKLISQHLDNWDISRIAKVDLSIIRLSTYSLFFQRDISGSIVIDEAVDISKKFSSEESYKFINGVLDGIYKEINVKKQ